MEIEEREEEREEEKQVKGKRESKRMMMVIGRKEKDI